MKHVKFHAAVLTCGAIGYLLASTCGCGSPGRVHPSAPPGAAGTKAEPTGAAGTPDEPPEAAETPMKLVDASLPPGKACEEWIRISIEERDAIPMVPGTEPRYYGVITGAIPAFGKSSSGNVSLAYDLDMADDTKDGIHCAGLFMAGNGALPKSGKVSKASGLADGQWQIRIFVVLDLVAHEGGLAARAAAMISMHESYRSGDVTFEYENDLDFNNPEIKGDVTGNGRKESVFLATAEERTVRTATLEDVNRMLESCGEDKLDQSELEASNVFGTKYSERIIILDENWNVLFVEDTCLWYEESTEEVENCLYTQPPKCGHYKFKDPDLGLGRVVFGNYEGYDTTGGNGMVFQCTENDKKGKAFVESDDATRFMLFNEGGWDVIFDLADAMPAGLPCDQYPRFAEVSVTKAKGGGPKKIEVLFEFEDAATGYDMITQVWTFDGTRYVLNKEEKK